MRSAFVNGSARSLSSSRVRVLLTLSDLGPTAEAAAAYVRLSREAIFVYCLACSGFQAPCCLVGYFLCVSHRLVKHGRGVTWALNHLFF